MSCIVNYDQKDFNDIISVLVNVKFKLAITIISQLKNLKRMSNMVILSM